MHIYYIYICIYIAYIKPDLQTHTHTTHTHIHQEKAGVLSPCPLSLSSLLVLSTPAQPTAPSLQCLLDTVCMVAAGLSWVLSPVSSLRPPHPPSSLLSSACFWGLWCRPDKAGAIEEDVKGSRVAGRCPGRARPAFDHRRIMPPAHRYKSL